MPWNKDDLTVVSWGRFLECNPDDHLHRKFALAHINSMSQAGIKFCFVDFGSLPPLSDEVGIKRIEADCHLESVAKNHGLLTVETPLVAFTDWRSLISEMTVAQTMAHLNQEGVPEHFILQAYPWEMSNYHRGKVILHEDLPGESIKIIENIAIPYSAPRLPGSSWQVCLTEDAASIRGWSEDVQSGCAADFHERMRAYCQWANGSNKGEILTRSVPITVATFINAIDHEGDQQLSPSLEKFITTADINSLKWGGI